MKATRIRSKGQRGVTLVELLIYMALLGIVSVSVSQVIIGSTKTYESTATMSTLSQDLRASMNFMTKDIRMAGCDVNHDQDKYFGFQPDCTANRIHFTSDFLSEHGTINAFGGYKIDGDGKSNSVGEDITYYLNSDEQILYRRARYDDGTGYGSIQDAELMENVSSLTFIYYGKDPTVVTGDYTNVHFVEIILVGQGEQQDNMTGEVREVTMTSRVKVRNKS